MNPANTAVGKLLSGKEAQFHFEQMQTILQDELASVKAHLRQPRPRVQYEALSAKQDALGASLIVLKSITLYQGK